MHIVTAKILFTCKCLTFSWGEVAYFLLAQSPFQIIYYMMFSKRDYFSIWEINLIINRESSYPSNLARILYLLFLFYQLETLSSTLLSCGYAESWTSLGTLYVDMIAAIKSLCLSFIDMRTFSIATSQLFWVFCLCIITHWDEVPFSVERSRDE